MFDWKKLYRPGNYDFSFNKSVVHYRIITSLYRVILAHYKLKNMSKKIIFVLTFLAVFIFLFSNQTVHAQNNTLTAKEKEEGWQLLFNGKDLSGWHSYLENAPGKAWQVKDGTIFLNKNSKSVYKDFANLTMVRGIHA